MNLNDAAISHVHHICPFSNFLTSTLPPSFPLLYAELLAVCGILGLLLHDITTDAASELAEGLSLLQHRGQDACGIITCGPKGRFYQRKANGMVRDVFDTNSISKLIGGMGVGHGTHSCSEWSSFLFFYSSIPDRWKFQPCRGSAVLC